VCRHSSRRFRQYGNPPRAEAQCIHCGSLERHRFVWLFLTEHTDLFDGRSRRVLHFAPERALEPLLRERLGAGYHTADIVRADVELQLDVTNLALASQSFDVVLCSHVLEHVPDDRLAMTEIHRVLAEQGWGLVIVPVRASVTFEDPTVDTPEKRLRVFGQSDHVRLYGLDIVDRLNAAGLNVDTHRASDTFSEGEITRMGLRPATRPIFTVRPVH
jgi:SAM-dependent methyltransferase